MTTPDVDHHGAASTPAADDAFAAELIRFITDDVALDDGEIVGDTDLLLTGLVDSLGVVVIVEWIENRLGRSIDPADVVLEHFQTVDAMVAFLRDA